MRHKKALWAIGAVALVVVVTLIFYGVARARDGVVEEHDHAAEMPVLDPEELEPSGVVEDGVRVVEVTAEQFEFNPTTIVVREGERVRLELTSLDVAHGLGLPAYDIDRNMPPNQTEVVEFTADRPGQHHFHCSVYCGEGHDEMHGTLVVLGENEQQGHGEGQVGHDH